MFERTTALRAVRGCGLGGVGGAGGVGEGGVGKEAWEGRGGSESGVE
jgi:hypothetical protein